MNARLMAAAVAAVFLGALASGAASAADRPGGRRPARAWTSDAIGHNAARFRFVCDRSLRRCAWIDANRAGFPGFSYAPYGWFGHDPTAPSGVTFPCAPQFVCSYQPAIGLQHEPLPLIR